MIFGELNLFCPVCSKAFRLNAPAPSGRWHSREFGHVCSKECHEESELKYARMILGKDDPPAAHPNDPATCTTQPTLLPDGSYKCYGCGMVGRAFVNDGLLYNPLDQSTTADPAPNGPTYGPRSHRVQD